MKRERNNTQPSEPQCSEVTEISYLEEDNMYKRYLSLYAIIIVICYCVINCTPVETPTVREVIASDGAPAAIGPYSQAIKVGNMLFCSGQIPINPDTGELVLSSIEEQTRQTLDNLAAVLAEAGMDFGDAVRATVFMDNMDNYGRINAVYADYFKDTPPARCAVEVSRLPKDVGVEISLIAVKGK